MDTFEVVALQNINKIGPAAVIAIMKYLLINSKSSILELDLEDVAMIPKLNKTQKSLLEENYPLFSELILSASNEISRIQGLGIDVISINDVQYPKLLKMIKSPPLILYCKGNLSLLDSLNMVAVVGTRENTEHGKIITQRTVQFLCENDYTIVSGLAFGIDAIAHQQAIDIDGKTIAVLVDVQSIQPSKHTRLASDIVEKGGLLISENPPGTSIVPALFIKRDRIQSGLSLGVIPIETSINGGTMHAVKSAVSEKRIIYVPDYRKSGYKDLGIHQLEGIKSLIDNEVAKPYTKAIYPLIKSELISNKKSLMTTTEQDSLL